MPNYKFDVDQDVYIQDFARAKIVGLAEYFSEALGISLPKYKVQTYLGNTKHLDKSVIEVHEHALTSE